MVAGLDSKKVIDVILGEAVGPNKVGEIESYHDMVAIASVIANRAKSLGATPEEVVGLKSEFNAQEPAPGMEQFRALAEEAVAQVSKLGPSHNATFYATPEATGGLPSKLAYETKTAGHQFYTDPQYRGINTTRGTLNPVNPTREAAKDVQRTLNALGHNLTVDGKIGPKTQAAIDSVKAMTGLDVRTAHPFDVHQSWSKAQIASKPHIEGNFNLSVRDGQVRAQPNDFFAIPSAAAINTGAFFSGKLAPPTTASVSGRPSIRSADIDPIDVQTNYVANYRGKRSKDPNKETMNFAKAAVGSYFGPDYEFVATSGKGYAPSGAKNSQHGLGRAVDGKVRDTRTGQYVSDKDTMYGFAAHMKAMDPKVSIGYDITDYMGPETIHIGPDDRGKRWAEKDPKTGKFSHTTMDPVLKGMIDDAGKKGSQRPYRSTLGQMVFPSTINVQPTKADRAFAPEKTGLLSAVPTSIPSLPASPSGRITGRRDIAAPVAKQATNAQLAEGYRDPRRDPYATTFSYPAMEVEKNRMEQQKVAPQPVSRTAIAPVVAPVQAPIAQKSNIAPTVIAPVGPRSSKGPAISARAAEEASMQAYYDMVPETAKQAVARNPVTDVPVATFAPSTLAPKSPIQSQPFRTQQPPAQVTIRDKPKTVPSVPALTPQEQRNKQMYSTPAMRGNKVDTRVMAAMEQAARNVRSSPVVGIIQGLIEAITEGVQSVEAPDFSSGGFNLPSFAPAAVGDFTVTNPSGGRGLVDVSQGPVSIGPSIVATPTPSSGGYRSVDDASKGGTGWSSYTNPNTGITTTFDKEGNVLGGPGLAPSVGGNSPGGTK